MGGVSPLIRGQLKGLSYRAVPHSYPAPRGWVKAQTICTQPLMSLHKSRGCPVDGHVASLSALEGHMAHKGLTSSHFHVDMSTLSLVKLCTPKKDGVGIPATLLRFKILYSVAQSGSLRLLKRGCKCINDTMPSPYVDEDGTLLLIRYVIDPILSTTH
ncbi:hypothetical protein COCC4DRAFT_124585 [Bipolaris maydis ATCC 48331]|uniref:Uncharacterized protein n=2 Tax=Cochliobolus heterostrophus TaxID=5016 RepID=M2V6T6_COCH5|nr:uncharacterized protein COCC4DRAFT_124585 [Bipolaris maydis ATCC 48331]EMD95737.1 hypothetical protein COCHEDRAFT_1151839 [Bipolaris maydis C5]ENI10597.1 hypothetical protein COCC4DRAFT_124585 [Bipolaris maydis ATCC 48331]